MSEDAMLNIDEGQLDKAMYMACNEAIVRSIVGITVNENRIVGTGTLVHYNGKPFVLTANHVVHNADLSECRFFIPPAKALVEHSMLDGIPKEFEFPAPGDYLSIGEPLIRDQVNDIAALPLRSTTLLPTYMRSFLLECMADSDSINDEASILILGFPVDNSFVYKRSVVPGHVWKALGLTSEHSRFLKNQQMQYLLHSAFRRDRHFVLEYTRVSEGITPPGFSGAGAWVVRVSESPVWQVVPILAGVVTCWHKETRIHPHLLQATRAGVIRTMFENAP